MSLGYMGGNPLRSIPAKTDAAGFAERLRGVVDAHGGASVLARAIRRSEGAVRKWMRAASEPNVTDLRAICAATSTAVAWLVNGAGERDASVSTNAPPSDVGSAHLPPDYALLESLVERVDHELAGARVVVTSGKRAALIVTLYQLFVPTKTIDPEVLMRLIKLAQA
jgi:hypothetical protein